MDDPRTVAPPEFVALIAALATYTGLEGLNVNGAEGLVFEAEPHTVVVFPHPGIEHWLLAEVDVIQIQAWEQLPHALLNQLNEAVRLEHGWTATLRDDQRLVLHTARPVASTSAAELEALMVDGIERAEALATVCQAAARSDPDSPAPEGDPYRQGIPPGFIRV
jgi:hypothetical protein